MLPESTLVLAPKNLATLVAGVVRIEECGIIKTFHVLRRIFERFLKPFKNQKTTIIRKYLMKNASDADGVAGVLVHPVVIKTTN